MKGGASPHFKAVEIILWIASICVAIAGVFWLPWIFGRTTPVPGESYALGFNNRFAILALATSIFLGVAARLAGRHEQDSLKWLLTKPRLLPPWQDAKLEYSILASSCLLWSAGITSWSAYLVDPAWGE